jgi:hypothetical protein
MLHNSYLPFSKKLKIYSFLRDHVPLNKIFSHTARQIFPKLSKIIPGMKLFQKIPFCVKLMLPWKLEEKNFTLLLNLLSWGENYFSLITPF